MVSKIALLAVLSFGVSTLANIYPDEDPCYPLGLLEGEYPQEYRQHVIRVWLDNTEHL